MPPPSGALASVAGNGNAGSSGDFAVASDTAAPNQPGQGAMAPEGPEKPGELGLSQVDAVSENLVLHR